MRSGVGEGVCTTPVFAIALVWGAMRLVAVSNEMDGRKLNTSKNWREIVGSLGES